MQCAVSVSRRPEEASFDDKDKEKIKQITKHITRALSIMESIHGVETNLKIGFDMLFDVGMPTFILTDKLDIISYNEHANELLQRKSGVQIINGKFSFSHIKNIKDMNEKLKHLILNCKSENLEDRSLCVNRDDGMLPLSILVCNINSNMVLNNNEATGSLNIAMIYVGDAARQITIPLKVFRKSYGFTHSESRVLEQILNGKTVSKASGDLDIAEATVRAHLRKLFEKTGTKSQAELIRFIMSSPIWQSYYSMRRLSH